MISPPDPFALSFDSIAIEPKRHADAETMAAFAAHTTDEAPPAPKPAADGPGFYLIDDANGRFTIDKGMGIVSLQHEHLLSIEAGAIHPVRIKVIEMSGANYEMTLRLRMTGRVPQIVGGEDNDMLAGLASEPLRDLLTPQEKAIQAEVAPEPRSLPWQRYSAFSMLPGKQALYGETAPFGDILHTLLPDVYLEASQLNLPAPLPEPSAAVAEWAL